LILLDTNVISELMRPEPAPQVVFWLDNQPRVDLRICAISVAEIRRGIWRLPDGKRKERFWVVFERALTISLNSEVLPFDECAANAFGELAARRQGAGFNTPMMDLMIAAIALTHNAKLATRNTRDFEGCGIELINPWQATGPS
jgi:predicted nucleic acid-binding protein